MDLLNAREFVVYKFSSFIADLLTVHCLHKPINILLATKLPPNPLLANNMYAQRFHYDHVNRILYLRRDGLHNVGEFILVLIHTLAHVHVDDLADDTNPEFMKAFNKALCVVCSDLFLARYKRANTLNDALAALPEETNRMEDIGKKMFESIFEEAHDEVDRSNVVNDLLDTKLIRNANFESGGGDYDGEVMFQRLRKYTDFVVGSKLKSFLGEVEDNLGGVKKQGTHIEIEKRLNELQVPVSNFRYIFYFNNLKPFIRILLVEAEI